MRMSKIIILLLLIGSSLFLLFLTDLIHVQEMPYFLILFAIIVLIWYMYYRKEVKSRTEDKPSLLLDTFSLIIGGMFAPIILSFPLKGFANDFVNVNILSMIFKIAFAGFYAFTIALFIRLFYLSLTRGKK